MKTIYIIKDGRPFWNEVTGYLRAVNADVIPMDFRTLLQSIAKKNPDIVIAGERAYKEVSSIPRNIPKIVITEGNIAETKADDICFLRWPVRRETFLEATSKFLSVPERRVFKTVITISLEGKSYLGKSVDFSMNGMAFRIDRTMKQGDIMTISFFIPGADKRFNIDAEVMRSFIDSKDNSVYYGAKFLNMDKNTKDLIEGFIKKI